MKLPVANLAVALLLASLLALGCSQPAAAPTQPPASPSKPTETTKAAEPTKAAAPTATIASAKSSFPQQGKSITLIVPWPAGGGTDISGRTLAAGLEKELGVPVQVVNKAGAGSQVGITELTQSKPDGYTLAYVSLPGGLVTYLDPERKAVYSRKQIQPVALHAVGPGTIAVKADAPYKDLTGFVEAAKANPNKLKVGLAGIMTLGHFEILQLQQITGAKFSLVQFDGAAPAMTAVLGGHVDAYISSMSDHLPHVKSGNARVLGVADTAPSKMLPGVKTFEEQGYKMTGYLSQGLIAPAGVPKDILATISAAAKRAMSTEEHAKKLEELGTEVRYKDTAEFEKFWDDLEASTKQLIPLAKVENK